MDARRRFIRRIEFSHLALAVAACAIAALSAGPSVLLGIVLGATVGGLNFRALALLAARMTRPEGGAVRTASAALLVLKMLALLGAVGATMLLLEPSGPALLAGISLAPLALLAVSVVARPTFEVEAAGRPR